MTTTDQNPITMYYDDACVICSTEAHAMQDRNPNRIRLMPVDAGLEELNEAGYTRFDAMTYLCVKESTAEGEDKWHTHMDAVRTLYKTAGVPWANVLYLPILKQLGDFGYPYLARNRYRIPDWVTRMVYGKEAMQACQGGVCKINPAER